MPNARVVFDDNVQVISPVAEAMARLGKTLAYDIPKMQMEREQMEYAKQSHAASSAAAAENRDYNRNRDAQQDARQARLDAVAADKVIYDRDQDVLSANAAVKKEADNDMLKMAQEGVSPEIDVVIPLRPTAEQSAASTIAGNVRNERAAKASAERNKAIQSGLLEADPNNPSEVRLQKQFDDGKIKEAKVGAVHIMPAGLRDNVNDEAVRNAVKGKYGNLIDGKLNYDVNDPDAAQKHQTDIDRLTIEAGYNPRNLLPLSPEERQAALDAMGAPSSATPATAPSSDTPSLQMEDETNVRRDAWRAKTDTFMADPANASFQDDRVAGQRPGEWVRVADTALGGPDRRAAIEKREAPMRAARNAADAARYATVDSRASEYVKTGATIPDGVDVRDLVGPDDTKRIAALRLMPAQDRLRAMDALAQMGIK